MEPLPLFNSKDFHNSLVRTQFNHVIESSEKSHLFPSVTVPDQSYSLTELLERHRQGILTDTEIMKEAQYMDEEFTNFDSPDVEKLRDADLTEREEYIQYVKNAKDSFFAKKKAEAAAEAERVQAEAAKGAKAEVKPAEPVVKPTEEVG